jgi:hypothetical protein
MIKLVLNHFLEKISIQNTYRLIKKQNTEIVLFFVLNDLLEQSLID